MFHKPWKGKLLDLIKSHLFLVQSKKEAKLMQISSNFM